MKKTSKELQETILAYKQVIKVAQAMNIPESKEVITVAQATLHDLENIKR